MNALAAQLQTYFSVFATTQRDLSTHTIRTYRDSWRLFLIFLAQTTGLPVHKIDLEHVTVENVLAFLNYLESQRGNSIATRNARLSAIKAVLAHAMINQLELAGSVSRIMALPSKRAAKPVLDYLTEQEADALIAAPSRDRWTGRRDHALFVLAIQTGLRASELCSLATGDVHLQTPAAVSCTGKGRRRRATPMTRPTGELMAAYLAERQTKPGNAVFCGPKGQQLSRDALEHRLKIHLATAAQTCPSIGDKHVTLHTLRHTTAMNLLSAGVDISVIALWLGHQQTHSANAYLHADMTMKQKAIDRTRPLMTEAGTYQPNPDILEWLQSL